MKVFVIIILSLIALYPSLAMGQEKDSLKTTNLVFTENKGQWDANVKYRTNINSGVLWIEKGNITFDLFNKEDLDKFTAHKHRDNKTKPTDLKSIRRHAYKINFLNYNNECIIDGSDKLAHFNNYFIGNNKEKWASNASNYHIISYKNIYNGIDLKIHESNSNIKWDFIVAANINTDIIKLEYEGVDKIRIKKENLEITTSVNKITELKPIAYQYNKMGCKEFIDCNFSLNGNVLSFNFPNSYDKTKELIIDPTLVFATYSGSGADNWGFTATYDSKGFLYGGGIVFGSGYPITTGAFQSSFSGIVDIGITKYDTTGTNLIYSTYLGGSLVEVPASLVVNSNDELIVFGTTGSSNFPTTALAYDNSYNGGTSTSITSSITFTNGSDLFVTHFNSTGTQLIASTYIGGSDNDGIIPTSSLVHNYGDDIRGEVVTDKNNNIYIVSTTNSSNFPVSANSFQTTKGNLSDGVIVKLDNNLTSIIWSSFFGGNDFDAIYGVKVASKSDIYITGGSISNNLQTTANVYQNTFQGGASDGFIAKIHNSGQNITFCTYIGSDTYDQSYLIDLDRYNNVYVFGQTNDTSNMFISNALWNSPNDGQFITKFNPTLSSRIWSTTWGNGNPGIDVVPSAFMVDLCNRVYLSAWGGVVNSVGNTNGLPITANAIQNTTDGSDYYLMVMTDDASALDYGSYYGGATSHEHVDGGTSRFDNKGRIYQNVCAGCGSNDDFPTTTGCYSSTNGSNNCNNGVFKIDFNIPAIVADYIIPDVLCLPDTSFFINTSFLSHPNLTQYSWDFGDGNTSNLESPWHIYSQSGIYNVELIIYDPQSCNLRDTINQQVVVLSGASSALPTAYICPGESSQIGILPLQDTSVHFNWTPPTALSSTVISNPFANPSASTWYTMTATNGLCTDTFHQKVEVTILIAEAGNDTSICLSSILLTGNGNYNGLDYLWSSSSVFNDTLNNFPLDSTYNHVFTNPAYLFFQISMHGCSDYDSLFIDQRIFTSPANIQNPLCNGDSNGIIQINVQGANAPISYNWNTGATTQNLSNIGQGTYSLTITDSDGCISFYDTTLSEPQPLIVDTISENIPCALACIGKAFANPQGGTAPYNWQWDDGSTQTTNPAISLCDGLYHTTVTDANNCKTTDSVLIRDLSIYIDFKAWASRDTIYEGETVNLNSTILDNSYIYSWTPSNGLSDPTIHNPTATLYKTTTFIVEAIDPYGCYWSDTITIYVRDVICDEPYIYVPNAFTPNNDGKNDYIKVEASVGYELLFQVYDRLGELVFETTDINKKWYGIFRGKELEPAVYVYHLSLVCFNKERFIKKGNITLIR